MGVAIGKYRDIIHFGRLIDSPDGQGGSTTAFLSVEDARAWIVPSATETTVDSDNRNVLRFTIDAHRVQNAINPDMVFKLNDESEIWKIKEAVNYIDYIRVIGEREIKASEVPPIPETDNGGL